MDPGDAHAYLSRGTSYMNTGRAAEALRDLQKAVALDPGSGDAWYNLSLLHRQAGNPGAALAAGRRAKEPAIPWPTRTWKSCGARRGSAPARARFLPRWRRV